MLYGLGLGSIDFEYSYMLQDFEVTQVLKKQEV